MSSNWQLKHLEIIIEITVFDGPSLKADISRSSWSFSDVSSALESCFQGAFIAPYVYEQVDI